MDWAVVKRTCEIYTNKFTSKFIVRLPHPRSGDSLDQETFWVPSADNQTRNYDTERSNQIQFMLSTLSSKVLDAMNGAVIYMRDINNNQLSLHSVSWVEPNLPMALRYSIYLFLSQNYKISHWLATGCCWYPSYIYYYTHVITSRKLQLK